MKPKRRQSPPRQSALASLRAHLEQLAVDARQLSLRSNTTSEVLHQLLDASPLGALVANNAGTYVFSNPAASELTGYSRTELLKLSVWQLTPNVLEREAEVLWRAFIDSGGQSGEYKLLSKGGRVLITLYAAKVNFLPGFHLSLLRHQPGGHTPA
jgi:PAS domain S-box-containing protein